MLEVLTDISRMLQTYRKIIASHALQVYYSAQVTMPQCHLIELSQRTGPSDTPYLLSERWNTKSHTIFIFEGHIRQVNSVVFLSDGKQIVSGSSDNTIQLWDARSGYEMAKLKGHTDQVSSVDLLPDGTQVVSGSSDRTI